MPFDRKSYMREYMARWRAEHPEEYRKRSRAYYAKNRDRLLKARKARYYAAKEENHA
jgi:hypothetical protein